jgi:metal-responsive CopG/Arc/MetJ family transcriptional regulator
MSTLHTMRAVKVTISIDSGLLERIDHLVKARVFANRSQVIQDAVKEAVARLDSNRLARECVKLDKAHE